MIADQAILARLRDHLVKERLMPVDAQAGPKLRQQARHVHFSTDDQKTELDLGGGDHVAIREIIMNALLAAEPGLPRCGPGPG